jgi:hypothetical protein
MGRKKIAQKTFFFEIFCTKAIKKKVFFFFTNCMMQSKHVCDDVCIPTICIIKYVCSLFIQQTLISTDIFFFALTHSLLSPFYFGPVLFISCRISSLEYKASTKFIWRDIYACNTWNAWFFYFYSANRDFILFFTFFEKKELHLYCVMLGAKKIMKIRIKMK